MMIIAHGNSSLRSHFVALLLVFVNVNFQFNSPLYSSIYYLLTHTLRPQLSISGGDLSPSEGGNNQSQTKFVLYLQGSKVLVGT